MSRRVRKFVQRTARLYHRGGLLRFAADARGATPRCSAPGAPSEAEQVSAAVAADIVREIERVAAKPLPQLSDDEVGRYTARLLDLVMERLKAGRRTDPRWAKARPAEMRIAHAH